MAGVFGTCLDDPRVSIAETDVGLFIRADKAAYDAILLDVDNGPEGLTRKENDALYDPRGLSQAHAALKPGGVLAVWSSAPDAGFTRRLTRTGFSVEEIKIRANGKRGARHTIWLATRKS
jgi:spermidine synthase